MSPDRSTDITELLAAWSDGDPAALDALMPAVYEELRRIARRHLRGEAPGHTLQTTALVNEAYLKLVGQTRMRLTDRLHFYAIAAQQMRRILVSMARARHAAKRGGTAVPLPLDESLAVSDERSDELVALDEALTALAVLDPRRGQVVELRYFGGLSVEETAATMGISVETVMRDWKRAKAWLYAELRDGHEEAPPPR